MQTAHRSSMDVWATNKSGSPHVPHSENFPPSRTHKFPCSTFEFPLPTAHFRRSKLTSRKSFPTLSDCSCLKNRPSALPREMKPMELLAALLLVAATSALPITTTTVTPTPPTLPTMKAAEWRNKTIYQIVTDRFAPPNSEDPTPACGLREYCGGTWRGIEQNLDYIAGMGFDAIWISPVTHSLEENTTWRYGYHGYWLDHPFTLNQRFGTAEDLRSLSDAIHARDMSLMVDVVINHFAINRNPPSYSHLPTPFNDTNAFHPHCAIDYSSQTSVEDCWLVHDQLPLLADVNTENNLALDALVQSVAQLVQEYSIDGIRLDTARHIPKKHNAQFQESVGIFVTGEVLDADVSYVSGYQGVIDSALNYHSFVETSEVFGKNSTFHKLAETLRREQTSFPDPTVLVNFLDNHDQPRLASSGTGVRDEMNAATLNMMNTGIPAIYYGFEQRLQGAKDPENRGPLWASG